MEVRQWRFSRSLRALEGVTDVRWYDDVVDDPEKRFFLHPVESG